MKTSRWFVLASIALIIVLTASHRSTAQTAPVTDTNSSLDQYTRLATPLISSGQTNLLNQISGMVQQTAAENKTVDIALTVIVLKDLREGNTNAAISLLETKLDDALVGYETLPRLSGSEKVIERARQYRDQYPHTSGNTNVDASLERALKYNAPQ